MEFFGKCAGLESALKILKKQCMVAYCISRHPQTPFYVKLLGFLVLAYALSPIDLIPDFIPVLGYLDDLIIVPAGIWCMYKLTPQEVIDECKQQAEGMDKKSKRNWTNYLVTALIVLLYLFLAWWFYNKAMLLWNGLQDESYSKINSTIPIIPTPPFPPMQR